MIRKDIGKNAPCPCGSGKKYKKCCYERDSQSEFEEHFLPPYSDIDYGEPKLDANFFERNKVHEISAARYVYSLLVMPELEKIVSTTLDGKINRSQEETKRIKETEDAATLVAIMGEDPDNINHMLLIGKILNLKSETIPLILEGFKKNKNDLFFELGVKVIKETGEDYADELVDILTHHQRNAHAISMLSLLLGFSDESVKSPKLLWNLYHYLKEHIPHETYSDGPLLALLEKRDKERRRMLRDFQLVN